MSFALLHATLGWAFAALAAVALRNRSADARCWAWRFGLLKGPLALLLAVPIAVSIPSVPDGRVRRGEERMTALSQVRWRSSPGGEGLGVRGPVAITRTNPPHKTREPAPAPRISASRILPLVVRQSKTRNPPLESGQVADAPSVDLAEASWNPSPSSLFPVAYILGLLTALAFRFAPRRAPSAMPRVEGVLRPRVVIPCVLDPLEAAMARAHEEAHVRRRDPFWSLVADLVCAALWFAPPVWLCARAMRAESEAACDAATLASGASRGAYARLLLAHAGPAPANALGGPARRLARRILMLERNAKPLSRPLAGVLLALGLVALLPWKAVAQAPNAAMAKGTLHGFGGGVPAVRTPLETAAHLMLEEPGVRRQVGWTVAQDAEVRAGAERWKRIVDVHRAELVRRQRDQTLKEAFAWDAAERGPMFDRADRASGSFPWTPEQARRLKSLALSRFGSAVWKDPEVRGRLGLTAKQLTAVTKANEAILRASKIDDMRGRPYPTPVMPESVRARVESLNAAYLAAPRERRASLMAKIRNVERPYRTIYRAWGTGEYKTYTQRRTAETWNLRADTDRRLEADLTETQRRTLHDLETDPDAWSRPYTYFDQGGRGVTIHEGVHLGPDRPALRPGKAAVSLTIVDGTRYHVWRRLHPSSKPGIYDYSVKVTPPRSAHTVRTTPVVAVPNSLGLGIRASRTRRAGDKTYLTASATLDGTRLSRLQELNAPGRSARDVTLKDGTTWRVYRDDTQVPYRYRVEKVAAAKSSPKKSPATNMQRGSTLGYLSRWSGLTINGPPAGTELGNVHIGVAQDPDGSTWTVYRARQSAPYTYALEHRTPARGLPTMLDYASGKITSELRRRMLSDRLPVTLQVDGKVWTIHAPSTKQAPFPSKVEPTDRTASWPKAPRGSRRTDAKPLVVLGETWTEASIRRHLHLQDGESLDFQPDPARPGEEVASLADREGIVSRNVVHRHREADGTYTYRVQSFIYVKAQRP